MKIEPEKIKLLSLCLTIQGLLDTKSSIYNFCDNIFLRLKDRDLQKEMMNIKRDLSFKRGEEKYLEGFKVVLIHLLDRLIGILNSKLKKISYNKSIELLSSCKRFILEIKYASSFEKIRSLENDFKSEITIPIMEMLKVGR